MIFRISLVALSAFVIIHPWSARAADRGFVRMCTGYATNFSRQAAEMSAQETQMFHARGFPSMSSVSPMLAEALRTSKIAGLPQGADISDISVAVRDIGNFSASAAVPRNAYAVKITTPSGARYAAVSFLNGKIHNITPLRPGDLLPAYNFAREMAAYMMLNDLLASDASVPRSGCVNAVKVQLGSAPGIIPELTAAMASEPQVDAQAASAALQAYRTFTRSSEARGNKLTEQTITQLTDSPDISFVYRDPDTTLGLGDEFDIIRLSKGAVRTYAMLAVDKKGVTTMSSPALCNVGNLKCGEYYEWP
jgi:hypothetical protein